MYAKLLAMKKQQKLDIGSKPRSLKNNNEDQKTSCDKNNILFSDSDDDPPRKAPNKRRISKIKYAEEDDEEEDEEEGEKEDDIKEEEKPTKAKRKYTKTHHKSKAAKVVAAAVAEPEEIENENYEKDTYTLKVKDKLADLSKINIGTDIYEFDQVYQTYDNSSGVGTSEFPNIFNTYNKTISGSLDTLRSNISGVIMALEHSNKTEHVMAHASIVAPLVVHLKTHLRRLYPHNTFSRVGIGRDKMCAALVLPYISAEYEVQFLREYSATCKERACVNEEECEGMSLPSIFAPNSTADGIMLREFLTPQQFIKYNAPGGTYPSQRQMCLLCIRAFVSEQYHKGYSNMIPTDKCIQNFQNIVDMEGEYRKEECLLPLDLDTQDQYGLYAPIVKYKSNMYRLVFNEKLKLWVVQQDPAMFFRSAVPGTSGAAVTV
jgi:hypothetical protein